MNGFEVKGCAGPGEEMDISLSAAIVQSLLRARQRGLPPAVLESTRLHIADALGIGAAARSTALAGQVMAAQGLLSGAGSCRLIGGGKAAPA
ncbi:MAG: hypothetical protein ACTS5Y_10805, partial [Pollutimonas bauzanensis]